MFKRKPESHDISHFLKIPIYMFKGKPESNDMSHFSKIPKLRIKFGALESHVTCEISI